LVEFWSKKVLIKPLCYFKIETDGLIEIPADFTFEKLNETMRKCLISNS
jgi:hypothetical protein